MRPPRPRTRRGERGQVAFLLVMFACVLLPLVPLVTNTSESVQAKIESQNAADKAAFTCVGYQARCYNLLANLNVAMLQLTGLATMIDAAAVTATETLTILEAELAIAQALVGTPYVGPVFKVLAGILEAQIQVMAKFQEVVNNLKEQWIPAMKKLRDKVLDPIVKGVVEVGLPVTSHVIVAAEGYDGDRGLVVAPLAFPRLLDSPGSLSEASFDGGYFPIERKPLKTYQEEGLALVYESPVYLGLQAFFVLFSNALAPVWFGLPPFDLPDYTSPDPSAVIKIKPIGQIPIFWTQHIQEATAHAAVLTRQPKAMDDDYVDRYFRFGWVARREAPEWSFTGLYGERAELDSLAFAEGYLFSQSSWDLLTPQWEAALVPNSKLDDILSQVPGIEAVGKKLPAIPGVDFPPLHH